MRTIKRAGTIAAAGVLILSMGLGPSAAAQAGENVVLTERTFTSEERTESFSGAVDSRALRIAVDAIGELAIADGESTVAYQRKLTQKRAPSIPADLFVACEDPNSVTVNETQQCLNSEELSERGFDPGENDVVGVESLVQAGIAQLAPVEDLTDVINQQVNATASGLILGSVIPGTEAICTNDDPGPKEAQPGLEIPDPLSSVISGKLGIASCQANAVGFPSASHASGEADLAITLTQTLVGMDPDPGVNDALDGIQEGLAGLPEELSGPINNVIDELQENIESHPLATIHVAPNGGELTSREDGILGNSNSTAVTVSVLGGILELTLGTADAQASILNESPATQATAATLHVKLLNIFTPEEGDTVIDEEIDLTTGEPQTIPGTEGTPLQSTIGVLSATEDSGCEVAGAIKTCTASSSGSAISLSLLEGDALPTITVELADAGTTVQAQYQTETTQANLPLARTGAGTLATVLAGGGLVALAAVVRRRFL